MAGLSGRGRGDRGRCSGCRGRRGRTLAGPSEGPAVGEGHGWAIFVFGTPDLVVDLGTIFCCDETHD